LGKEGKGARGRNLKKKRNMGVMLENWRKST